jgi:hypothetical protein
MQSCTVGTFTVNSSQCMQAESQYRAREVDQDQVRALQRSFRINGKYPDAMVGVVFSSQRFTEEELEEKLIKRRIGVYIISGEHRRRAQELMLAETLDQFEANDQWVTQVFCVSGVLGRYLSIVQICVSDRHYHGVRAHQGELQDDQAHRTPVQQHRPDPAGELDR